MTEAQLTRQIVRKLNKLPHVYCRKIHSGMYQGAGLPDVVGLIEGAFFGLEVKLPGKERNLTDIQAATLKKIEKAGGLGGVITSYEEALEIIGYEHP